MPHPVRAAIRLALLPGLALLGLAPRPLPAQQEFARGTVLKGVVYDSLFSRRPLVGAEVWVEGTDRSTRTDSRGRWELEDVPSSRHRIVAWHPRLDSVGFSAPVRQVDLTGLPSAYLTLATPAAATVYERQCPGIRPRASGVLLGTVLDVEGEQPIAGVTVEARWVEWAIGRRTAPTVERVIADTTDASGRFRLCTVPNDVALTVSAVGTARRSGALEVHLNGREVGAQHLRVGAPAQPGEGGTLQGRVLGGNGQPLTAAEVHVLGHPTVGRTNADGEFFLLDQPTGSQTVEIRAIGHAPRRHRLTLQPRQAARLEVVLEKTGVVLPELSVTGRPTAVDLSGFELRRRGGRGIFLDEEQIRKRRAMTPAELFIGIPGVEVTVGGNNGIVLFTRSDGQIGKFNKGMCYPQYYVDGVLRLVGREDPMSGDLIPIGRVLDREGLFNADMGPGQLVRTEDIAAIEIYKGTADAPPQYSKLDAGCGVILIWTRRGKPNSWYREQDGGAEPEPDPLPEKNPQ